MEELHAKIQFVLRAGEKMIYFCITFDVPNSYEEAPKTRQEMSDWIKYTIKFLDEIGCREATFFVDEFGYNFTKELPENLVELLDYGEIGLHSHLNYPPHGSRSRLPKDYHVIHAQIKTGKEKLEEFLRKYSNQRVISIRSGNFLTSKVYFKAIYDLGFKIDSSIIAYHSIKTMTLTQIVSRYVLRKVGIKFHDINSLPAGAQPYYFNLNAPLRNANDGDMLEVPVNIFTRMLERGFNLEELVSHQLSRNRDNDKVIITFCMHPFEFLKFNALSKFFISFNEKHGVKFVRIKDIQKIANHQRCIE